LRRQADPQRRLKQSFSWFKTFNLCQGEPGESRRWRNKSVRNLPLLTTRFIWSNEVGRSASDVESSATAAADVEGSSAADNESWAASATDEECWAAPAVNKESLAVGGEDVESSAADAADEESWAGAAATAVSGRRRRKEGAATGRQETSARSAEAGEEAGGREEQFWPGPYPNDASTS
ncbi:hypothetical protein CHARACLAT_016690, partial [Characodon lateralis]|nr:hypothetical protein [Characodon lateralis]